MTGGSTSRPTRIAWASLTIPTGTDCTIGLTLSCYRQTNDRPTRSVADSTASHRPSVDTPSGGRECSTKLTTPVYLASACELAAAIDKSRYTQRQSVEPTDDSPARAAADANGRENTNVEPRLLVVKSISTRCSCRIPLTIDSPSPALPDSEERLASPR